MLYKKSREEFDEKLFLSPPKEYRGAPFWAWNGRLNTEQLLKQIPQFHDMGMGGAHIHCRVGLDTPYLSEEFFQNVKECQKEFKKENMLCWLYDEDRWPSGTAGGYVTQEKKYRACFLVVEPYGYSEKEDDKYMAAAQAVRSKDRRSLGVFEVILDQNGYLKKYRQTDPGHSKNDNLWQVWMEISGDTPWFNNQAYVNTMDKDAVNRFIELTHEQYYKHLGNEFGKSIPAIFTDEPQTVHKEFLRTPFEKKPVILPYTADLEETFRVKYGSSLLEHLPELIWESAENRLSRIRYLYHRHICERFSEAYCDNIAAWCGKHGLALTGHMLNEWTLYSQTMAVGEVMRPLKDFTVPGMDMLCDRRELSTAKQVQSISRQMGREGCMSEIYGVTGWDYDFRNHKLAGDWQAALGVTLRVPHLTWFSMSGEAKRDYPASIGYQSPWYKEYHFIEDHFARLNTVLTRGTPEVKIGVIHPIESYWIYWGNQEQTSSVRQMMEENFEHMINWMLYGLLDFDFISESVLDEEEKEQRGKAFIMGEMLYDVVIVPGCITLRNNTYERLRKFRDSGGNIIFAGNIPGYIDAKKDDRVEKLADKCTCIEFNRSSLYDHLEKYRDIDISVRPMDGIDPTRMKQRENGTRSNNMFYQIRKEGKDKWLFVCHVNRPANEHITYTEELKITVKGEYTPVLYDTLSGKITELGAEYDNSGDTLITAYTSSHDSLLFKLLPGRSERGEILKYNRIQNMKELPCPDKFILEEENCCLLDTAEYAFDNEEWQTEEEILRIDNKLRKRLDYPLRMEAWAQPWTDKTVEIPEHRISLRFRVLSDIEENNVLFAGENLETSEVICNGVKTILQDEGFYVDECIRKYSGLSLKKGENIIQISMPFMKKTNLEWYYLLGNFGVKVMGKEKKIQEYPSQIYYGNYVDQGFPFYAGNFIYETAVETEKGDFWLEISHYKGALIQVQIDDGEFRNLIFAPYRINCGAVSKGRHKIRIKVYGNRVNAFGAVHNADASEKWYGPNIWRTEGNKWCYEYQLKEMGILTTPVYSVVQ